MIVVTGATSNTGKVVAASLIDAGKKIRVIGRSLARLQPFVDRGAEAFEADPTDGEAMSRAFVGASAAYIMLQPGYLPESHDFPAFQERILNAVVPALAPAGIRHVVALSGWGVNFPQSTGPLRGLRMLEQRLSESGVPNVLKLRAGWFMENAESMIEELLSDNVAHGPLRGDLKLPMIATADVGKIAAKFLIDLDFFGSEVVELQGSEELTLQEATAILARLVGKSDARYVQLSTDELLNALRLGGFSDHMANAFIEISADVNAEHIRMLSPVADRIVSDTHFEAFARSVLGKKGVV